MASNRLTNQWTETLDEAYGPSGTKGRIGEQFLCRVFESWGWEWKLNDSDYQAQVEGRDIEFRSPNWYNFYSADIKNNMDRYGTFFVYKDWLFKVKCDRIFHVNPETGWVVWYNVESMRRYYDKTKDYIKINTSNRPSFVTVRKVDITM